jgi:hypothetical protein
LLLIASSPSTDGILLPGTKARNRREQPNAENPVSAAWQSWPPLWEL